MPWMLPALLLPGSMLLQVAPAAAPTAYRVLPDSSSIWVVTHRSGLLSFLGHEHAIVPREWSGSLCLSDPVAVGDRASLTVVTASLVIDSDSARVLAGLGGGPGAGDRREIQRKMLDTDHLDVARFPEAHLELRAAETRADGVLAQGILHVHGVQREVAFPLVVVRHGAEAVRLSGVLRIRQRDFGIEPESLGGVVKVSDEVDLHFDLLAVPTGGACTAGPPTPPGQP